MMVSIQRLLFALAAAAPAASALQMSAAPNSKSPVADAVFRRGFLGGSLGAAAASAALVGVNPSVAGAEYKGLPEGRSVPADQRERGRGPAGVNKPELLPEGPTRFVIDLDSFKFLALFLCLNYECDCSFDGAQLPQRRTRE